MRRRKSKIVSWSVVFAPKHSSYVDSSGGSGAVISLTTSTLLLLLWYIQT